jgi:hypothetical protein
MHFEKRGADGGVVIVKYQEITPHRTLAGIRTTARFTTFHFSPALVASSAAIGLEPSSTTTIS